MESVIAIILNYNSSKDVDKCLSYLVKQEYDDFRQVVVDNCSPSEEEKTKLKTIVKKYHCECIQNDKNEGFSAGNNIGIQYAQKNKVDWCLIINPDVEIKDTKYIAKAMNYIKQYKQAVVVGTNVLLPSGKRQNPMRELSFFEEFLWPIETIKQRSRKWKGYLGDDKTGYCEKLVGCCFFINTAFISNLGYLDENVFMYSEEPILAKIVSNNRRRMLYISELTAFHQHYESKKGSNTKKMEMFINSRIYYLKKYSGYSWLKLHLLIISKQLLKKYVRIRGKSI